MNNKFREYFIFSRGERNGIFLLIGIIIILLLSINFNQYLVEEKKYDFTAIQKTTDSIYALLDADTIKKFSKSKYQKYAFNDANNINSEIKYFFFDPNKIDQHEWELLGLKPWQAKIIEKYKGKGGTFRVKKDLAKMYSIEPETYMALEPYILLPDIIESKYKDSNKLKYYEYKKIENILLPKESINTVDSITLLSIKGLGPYLVSKILYYRRKLGGFVSINQLKEIDTGPLINIDIYITAAIEEKYFFDVENIKKININSASAEQLRKHPYMNLPAANAIVLNRINNGKYVDIEQIKNLQFMTIELYNKMLPYLNVE
jgi:competence protein ComEA